MGENRFKIENWRVRVGCCALFASMCTAVLAQAVSVHLTPAKAVFMEGRDSVLVYNAQETSWEGAVPRANYIHPLFGLDGTVLTEDFPQDHLHHRGIFWAWHQLYVGDQRIGDGWEIKDFSWRVVAMDTLNRKGPGKTLQANVVWESPAYTNEQGVPQPLVMERTEMTVHPLKNHVRAVDIAISMKALVPQMTIGGSEDEKGYGGFSARIILPEDVEFSNEHGSVLPTNTPVDPSAWIQVTGSMAHNGSFGLTIIPHKENPGYPHPWILREKASMQNAVYPFPGRHPVPLSMEIPTVLRYRLLVHEKKLSDEELRKFLYDQ